LLESSIRFCWFVKNTKKFVVLLRVERKQSLVQQYIDCVLVGAFQDKIASSFSNNIGRAIN